MAQALHVSAASRVKFGPPISANGTGTPVPEAPWGSWFGIRKPTSSQRARWRPNFGPGRCLFFFFFAFQAVGHIGRAEFHPPGVVGGGAGERAAPLVAGPVVVVVAVPPTPLTVVADRPTSGAHRGRAAPQVAALRAPPDQRRAADAVAASAPPCPRGAGMPHRA